MRFDTKQKVYTAVLGTTVLSVLMSLLVTSIIQGGFSSLADVLPAIIVPIRRTTARVIFFLQQRCFICGSKVTSKQATSYNGWILRVVSSWDLGSVFVVG